MKPSAEIWAAVFPRSPTSKYAQANITEQHQPRQSTPPPLPLDWQENKDHVSRTYNSLRCEMNKLNMWKVRVHSELSKKEEAVRMAQETADALQKSTRQTQLENVHLSTQLQDVIDIKGDLMEKIRATRQMCDDLKGQSSSVQQTLTRGTFSTFADHWT
ncbi:synaptonemal complex protein 1-like [Petromyzon marinus]|uniref:synaptonemal complex protein 1-like n=1 Tax=Petromyzon marinus TaxID=7757 RepID=UPI003F71A0E1